MKSIVGSVRGASHRGSKAIHRTHSQGLLASAGTDQPDSDLSKIEAGQLELRMETFAADGAIEEVLSSIRPQGEAKAIRIEADLGSEITLAAVRHENDLPCRY